MRISDWSSDVCSSDLRSSGDGRSDTGQRRRRADSTDSVQLGRTRQTVRGSVFRGPSGVRGAGGPARVRRAAAGLERSQTAATDRVVADTTQQHAGIQRRRSEEHTSELQSLMRQTYAVSCLKKKKV